MPTGPATAASCGARSQGLQAGHQDHFQPKAPLFRIAAPGESIIHRRRSVDFMAGRLGYIKKRMASRGKTRPA